MLTPTPGRRPRRRTARAATALLLGGATALASGLTAAPALASTPLSPTAARPAASGPAQPVIVVLKDQLRTTPADARHRAARGKAARTAQDAVLGRLTGALALGRGAKVKHFTTGNAFAATLTPAQQARLAADPRVAAVVPDRKVSVAPVAATPATSTAGVAAPRATAAADPGAPAKVDPSVCSATTAGARLEPEALQSLRVRSDDPAAKTAAALGIDGSGVTVGFIADGLDPQNTGFLRPDGTSAVVDYQDFYGDGPSAPASGAEAFGDASSIAAQDGHVYDVAQYANPGVVDFSATGGHCYIRVVGVAPGARVVALKAGSELLPNSAILQAIDYAVGTAHVDVLNESFGGDINPDTGTRGTIQLFNDNAVAAGVTVTVSTGDAGITSTIGNPAADPQVIAAAASTDSRIYEQTGYALATRFSNGTWRSSNVSALSSGGVTNGGRVPDVLAPGEADWALCSDAVFPDGSPRFSGCANFHRGLSPIQPFGGTSQSAPLTAGVAALVIQAYRQAHGGSSPSPALVKQLLTSTARDLGFPGEEQGSGLLDARAAVEAALQYRATTPSSAAGLAPQAVLDQGQLLLEGKPGSTVTGTVRVTDGGTAPLTVAASSRRLTTLSTQSQQTSIDAGSSQTTPYPTTGAPWVYKTLTFQVPAGADRLGASVLWQSGSAPGSNAPAAGGTKVVRVSLFAPDGAFETNTRPQGGPVPANYGFVDVRKPQAGTWTAVLYTPAGTGFSGPVTLTTTAERAVPVGSVSPATTTVAPGATAPVTASFQVPTSGGDTTYVLQVGASGGQTTAVPVVVRTLVDTAQKGAQFAGTITGGNARGARAQTFTYAFDVTKGHRDVAASVTLSDKADVVETVLADPNGEVQSVSTNARTAPDGSPAANSAVAQSVAANPVPGRWQLIVAVQNPVSGTAVSAPFTGRVQLDAFTVTGAPDGTAVKAGKSKTVKVTVTNRSAADEVVQLDPRTTKVTDVQLVPVIGSDQLQLPQSVDDLSSLPGYLVPPSTSALSTTAASSLPAQVELNNPTGSIDVFGDLKAAQGGSTVSTASVSETRGYVGTGLWSTYVQEIGPFTDARPAQPGTSQLSATARTLGFDRTVTSSTGDPWLGAVDTSADSGTGLVVAPGQKVTITLTIRPTAKAGSTVRGVLNVVTPVFGYATFNTTGDVLASLPYSYEVS